MWFGERETSLSMKLFYQNDCFNVVAVSDFSLVVMVVLYQRCFFHSSVYSHDRSENNERQ